MCRLQNIALASVTEKCDDRRTDRQTTDKVIPMCRYASQATQTSPSPTFWPRPPRPQGHGKSVKCEEPIDELTVQVWLLYHHPHFYYCTLFESGTELRTDKRTDNPITRCPRRTFQAGGLKIHSNSSSI